jgi:hypothetical protein
MCVVIQPIIVTCLHYEPLRFVINDKPDGVNEDRPVFTAGFNDGIRINPSSNSGLPPSRPPPGMELAVGAKVPKHKCDTYLVYHEENSQVYNPLTFQSYDEIELDETEAMTGHQYFLCASHLWEYILKNRKYDMLACLDGIYRTGC